MNVELKLKIRTFLNVYLAISGFCAFPILLLLNGFYLSSDDFLTIKSVFYFLSIAHLSQELFRFILVKDIKTYLRKQPFLKIQNVLIFILIFLRNPLINSFLNTYSFIDYQEAEILYMSIILLPIILSSFVNSLSQNYLFGKLNLTPGLIFALSFAFIILLGAFCLTFPKAAYMGRTVSFVDALFTSTSAVCVTGLTSLDTANTYTVFGKIVIVALIQIGGLGVMTLTTFFAAFLAGGMSFTVKKMMLDILSADNFTSISKLLLQILGFTFAIEGLGAAVLYFSLGGSILHPDFTHLGSAVFHSVSAFCNAGFSTYSANLADPMIFSNYLFNSTIMLLIIFGGLGFTVIANLAYLRPFDRHYKRVRYQLTLSSKIAILSTFTLVFGGALVIWFFEPFAFNQNLSQFDKFFHSLFLSVTPRTAGFNTVPSEGLAGITAVIIIVLMWIGASPGSTGGGIKTSTSVVALFYFFNIMKGKSKLELFNREIDFGTIHKAFLLIFAYFLVLVIGSCALVYIEKDKNVMDLVFEASSALSTVGLSRNLTYFLSSPAKLVLTAMMFIGRVGCLTFFTAMAKPSLSRYSLPKENIMIG